MKHRRRRVRTDVAAERYAEAMSAYVVFFDGCCEPRNPGGTAGFGVVIFKGTEKVWEKSGMIQASPTTSNNVAEYAAIGAALDWFIENGLTDAHILVKGDSNLVIQQCFGTWKIRGGFYADLAREVREKIAKFKALRGTWISRDYNGVADELSKNELRRVGVEFKIQPEV